MLIAKVEAVLQTTRRTPALDGRVIVRVRCEDGTVRAAVDPLRTTPGDTVLVAEHAAGRCAVSGTADAALPIDAAVIAVVSPSVAPPRS